MKKPKSVFYDLGYSESESAALTFKADLYIKVVDVIKSRKLSAREVEKILDVPQPRVSELMNGKFSKMSIEKLLIYLEKLGVVTFATFKVRKVG